MASVQPDHLGCQLEVSSPGCNGSVSYTGPVHSAAAESSTLPQRSLGATALTASLPLPPPPLAPVGLLFCAVPLECCTAGTCPSITVLRYSALSRYSLNCNSKAQPVATPGRAAGAGAHYHNAAHIQEQPPLPEACAAACLVACELILRRSLQVQADAQAGSRSREVPYHPVNHRGSGYLLCDGCLRPGVLLVLQVRAEVLQGYFVQLVRLVIIVVIILLHRFFDVFCRPAAPTQPESALSPASHIAHQGRHCRPAPASVQALRKFCTLIRPAGAAPTPMAFSLKLLYIAPRSPAPWGRALGFHGQYKPDNGFLLADLLIELRPSGQKNARQVRG